MTEWRQAFDCGQKPDKSVGERTVFVCPRQLGCVPVAGYIFRLSITQRGRLLFHVLGPRKTWSIFDTTVSVDNNNYYSATSVFLSVKEKK